MKEDYCTGWLEGLAGVSWAHCCKAHDEAYALILKIADLVLLAQAKAAADVKLGQCVAATGNDDMGFLMMIGTLTLGWAVVAFHKIRRSVRS